MKIIGIHNGHDASITAMEDGVLIGHWEAERHYYRAKHMMGSINGNLMGEMLRHHVLPLLGWQPDEIDILSLCGLHSGWFGAMYQTSEFRECVGDRDYSPNEPHIMWTERWGKKDQRFFASLHHLNHLAYSYYTSPFESAVLLAYDGQGDFNTTTTIGWGDKGKTHILSDLSRNPMPGTSPNFFGLAYGETNKILPWLGKETLAVPGKAMALASYGSVRDEWLPWVKEAILDGDMNRLAARLQLGTNVDSQHKDAQDFLATFQYAGSDYVRDLVSRAIQSSGCKNLCLSGGCALNVPINAELSQVANVYVPPAPSDCGQSIGSVLFLWHHVLNKPFSPMRWHDPYLGPSMAGKEILDYELRNRPGLIKTDCHGSEFIKQVAAHLKNGGIVGWAQGRMEIGPRSLGNRSILASPLIPGNRETINFRIKKREWWRPLAPVCREEDAAEFFDTNEPIPYMTMAVPVKPEKRELLGAVVHVDGTARLQTVSRTQNPKLHALLGAFADLTGVPILLNTSLNGPGKPIANKVATILDLLENTELTCVAIDDHIIRRAKLL